MGSAADQAVVDHALQRGWIDAVSVQALRQHQQHMAAAGTPTPLLTLLASHLEPVQVDALRQVYERAASDDVGTVAPPGGPPVAPPAAGAATVRQQVIAAYRQVLQQDPRFAPIAEDDDDPLLLLPSPAAALADNSDSL